MVERRLDLNSKLGNSAIPRVTFLPVLIGTLACLGSLGVLALSTSGNPLIYIAYLCTPFAPIGGLALARSIDIKGRTNTKFDIAKSDKVVKFCGVIAVVGFLIAIAVMYEIAMRHSQV
jgi:hypothetical protein